MSSDPINPAEIKGFTTPRHCDWSECQTLYQPKRSDSRFCSPACRKAFWRRREVRGAQAVDQLIKWRKSRNSKDGSSKGLLGDIARIVDGWIREDSKEKKS